jgi:hypothetical protein
MNETRCIFCNADAANAAEEHVISAALGCKEVIKGGICTTCNNRFGHSFEATFVNGLALFRNFCKIPNAEGVVPDVVLKGRIGSEEFTFEMTGNGRAHITPQLLQSVKTAAGQEREFRIFQKAQESRIENDLRAKHGGLIWTRLEDKELVQIIDVEASFEPSLLCSPEANRTVAKYALNLLIHQYGYDSVNGHFQSLIDYIKGESSSTCAGIFWERGLLEHLPFEPPKHVFIIVQDGKAHMVTVFIYLFSLFPFCVITEESSVVIDSFKDGAIDPHKGRITRLILEGTPAALGPSPPPFPAPDFRFAQALASVEIGTERRAALAARKAMTFMQRVLEAQPGMPHICYSCKKVLQELTPVCKYCGKSPVPERTAPRST